MENINQVEKDNETYVGCFIQFICIRSHIFESNIE